MIFLLLATISVAYALSIRRIERLRRALTSGELPNMAGVWTFAATITLPAHLIAALVVVAYAAEWPAQRAVAKGRHRWRYIYTIASVLASCEAATVAFHEIGGPLGVAVALPTFCVLNLATIGAAMLVAGQFSTFRRMVARPRAHVLEVSTQCAGAATAGLLAWHAPLSVLVLPVVIAFNHWYLRRTITIREAFDSDTGLWSETAWTVRAEDMLADTGGCVALMIIDPYSRGADVLGVIRPSLDPADLLGRYGPGGIALMMNVGRPEAASMMSAGFRADLAAAGVTAALGCATASDGDLQDVLIASIADLMTSAQLLDLSRP